MRYAVTGATGFLGGALARRLLADGHDVVCTVRSPDKAVALAALGATVERADLAQTDLMAAAFAGSDGVFHVAGWYKVGDRHPENGWTVNVEGTKNALAAAKAAGVPRIVHTSTCAVNSDTGGRTVDETYRFTGEHLTVYDETKARAHEYAETFARSNESPEVVITMPGGIYGPGDTSQLGVLMQQVVERKRVLATSRLRMMQAHVDDVADGHVRAMADGRPGESYMLAGERTDMVSMLTELAAITGGRKPMDIPAAMFPVTSAASGLLGRVLPLPSEFAPETLRTAQASYLGTSVKAFRELGWTFRPLHTGLADVVEAEGWPRVG